MDRSRLTNHFSPLDGIRGVAILLVILEHLFYIPESPIWLKPLEWVSGTGWIGVDLFFVLSGFLITGILIDRKGSENYFKNFYMRRVLRIFPLNYLYLVLFTTGMIFLISNSTPGRSPTLRPTKLSASCPGFGCTQLIF